MNNISLINLVNSLKSNKVCNSISNIERIPFINSYFFNKILNSNFYYLKLSNSESFYYCLYYIIYNLNINEDINHDNIIKMVNKLILNINNNKSYFKNITNKCKKSTLIDFFDNMQSNEYTIQYICEILNSICKYSVKFKYFYIIYK